MPKSSSARRGKQGQSSSAASKRRRSRSSAPEPPGAEPIMPGLTRDQWSLALDPRHRFTALRLAATTYTGVVNIDALMHSAQEALIAAVREYKPGRVSFVAYARRRMRSAMVKRVREQQIPERLLRWRQDLIWHVALSDVHDEPAEWCQAPDPS